MNKFSWRTETHLSAPRINNWDIIKANISETMRDVCHWLSPVPALVQLIKYNQFHYKLFINMQWWKYTAYWIFKRGPVFARRTFCCIMNQWRRYNRKKIEFHYKMFNTKLELVYFVNKKILVENCCFRNFNENVEKSFLRNEKF